MIVLPVRSETFAPRSRRCQAPLVRGQQAGFVCPKRALFLPVHVYAFRDAGSEEAVFLLGNQEQAHNSSMDVRPIEAPSGPTNNE